MTFEELKKAVKEDLDVDTSNLEQKSLKLSSIYVKYLDNYMNELRKLKTIQAVKDKKYTEVMHDLRKNGHEKYEVKGKDIDHYVHLNSDYIKLVSDFKEQEYIVKYLESVMEQVNKISFNIKNFVDLQKVKMGIG